MPKREPRETSKSITNRPSTSRENPIQFTYMQDSADNLRHNVERCSSLKTLIRSDSSISSSTDFMEALTNSPTETSSISTNGSNEEARIDVVDESAQSKRWKRMRKKAGEIWTDFLESLADTNEQIAETQAPKEADRLNPRTLQRDISRSLTESHVYLEMMAGVYEFFIWKNPLASLCAFCVLVYCLYKEVLVTVLLGLILFQLALNYLESQKKINIGLRFLPSQKISQPKLDLSGVKLIFDVARHAQRLLTICADCLEKLRSLFMWKKPEVTLNFVFFISFFFLLSILISFNTYVIFVGCLAINKMFTMTYLYYRFPNSRFMFDIAFYFYRHTPVQSPTLVPTVAQVRNAHPPVTKKRTFPFGSFLNSPVVRRDTVPVLNTLNQSNSRVILESDSSSLRRNSLNILTSPPQFDTQSISTENSDTLAVDDQDNIFKITRSCTFVDKTENCSRTVAGTIILTDQCFTFRSMNAKNVTPFVIEVQFELISTIRKVKKLHPLSRLKPGSSKGIELEINNPGNKQQYQFLGITKREDFFESLVELARLSGSELQQTHHENV